MTLQDKINLQEMFIAWLEMNPAKSEEHKESVKTTFVELMRREE